MKLSRKLALDYYLGGLLHMALKPPTILLGKLLGRDHDLMHCSTVTVIKMMGGGSLVIAYPALLALRKSPRIKTLRLVTTPAVRPFAEILGVFDEIIVVREDSLPGMAADSIRAISRLFRSDAIVDLEVHSRLSTVFSLLTCARNRVGFYTSIAFWRKGLSTHLVFCNLSNGIYYFYDQIARLFGGVIPDIETCRSTFRSRLTDPDEDSSAGTNIAIAPCCSALAKERQLSEDEWVAILEPRVNGLGTKPVEIYLMGAPSDRGYLASLAEKISEKLPEVKICNLAGRSSLAKSVAVLQKMDTLFCIDSSLLHFARLVGIRTVSYWGPTNPATLLRPGMVDAEEVFYRRLSCSPCIHVADTPPCGGNNLCMRAVATLTRPVRNVSPTWVVVASLQAGSGTQPAGEFAVLEDTRQLVELERAVSSAVAHSQSQILADTSRREASESRPVTVSSQ